MGKERNKIERKKERKKEMGKERNKIERKKERKKDLKRWKKRKKYTQIYT